MTRTSANSDHLSANLAALLPKQGTDSQIAKQLGVEQSSVWRWRNGRSIPDAEHVEALAVLIGLACAELRYGDYTGSASVSTAGAVSEMKE